MKTVTYTEMDSSELEDLARSTFGWNVELVSAEEWGNDQKHSFKGIKKGDVEGWSEYDYIKFNEFLEKGRHSFGITNSLLEYFVYMEMLPEGDYLIDCSW